MTIYLDLELLLNFCYDLILLLTVDITLKRYSKIYRHIISSVIGSLSIIILFLPFSDIVLFILKILVSIIMILISFSYKNIIYTINNLLYLYMSSVILGGFIYLFKDKFKSHYIILLIISPLILFLYIRMYKNISKTYNYTYKVEIYFTNNIILKCNGFLDTGNNLKDLITGKYIILLSKRILTPYINNKSPIYVPYKGVNSKGLIECFKIKYLKINNKVFKEYMVGLSEDSNIECLLNAHLMEDI